MRGRMTKKRDGAEAAAPHRFAAATLGVALGLVAPAAGAAEVVLWVDDTPGVGFHDPTPAEPTGGNLGVTLGQQRYIAFLYAAQLWGAQLKSPVPIVIQANFEAAYCSGGSALLGWAGSDSVHANFSGAPLADTYYHAALADSLAGEDLRPERPDIYASFNSALDESDCLGDAGWYYGLDGAHGPDVDLVQIVLHEIGHGLGFSNFVDEATGATLGDSTTSDVFARNTFDIETGVHWDSMTDMERAASAERPLGVVWDGPATTSAVPGCLSAGAPVLRVGPGQTPYRVVEAQFGAGLSAAGLAGELAVGRDGLGNVADGCEPLENLAGKLALLSDSGACSPDEQAGNASAAGAIGVVVLSSSAKVPPPALAAGGGAAVPVPVVSVAAKDAAPLLAAAGESAVLLLDEGLHRGTDFVGRALLYTPNPVSSGSSGSHFDTTATPNLLMEPYASANLPHRLDLTLYQLADVGWEIAPLADPCGEAVSIEPPEIPGGNVPTHAGGPPTTESMSNRSAPGCSSSARGASLVASFGAAMVFLLAGAARHRRARTRR